MWIRSGFGWLLVSIAVAPLCLAQTHYAITNIGALPGDNANTPAAINNSGQIVGQRFGVGGNGTYLWDSVGGLQAITGLPGPQSSFAADINDAGVIVGDTSGAANLALLWVPPVGPFGVLPMPAGTVAAGAKGINNNNVVIGYASPSPHPFVFDLNVGGPALPVVDPQGTLSLAVANSINDAGTIVGVTSDSLAFALAPGQVAEALGTLPGHVQSTALDINSASAIVGQSAADLSGRPIAGFYRSGAGPIQDLGQLRPADDNVTPYAVNDSNHVVGSSGADGLGYRAFVWTPALGMRDINELIDPEDPLGPVVTFFAAVDINDSGQIVATGLFNGLGQTFLLDPLPVASAAPAVRVSFSGTLIAVDDTSAGAATFSGASPGDVFSGQVTVGASEAGSAFVPPAGYFFPSDTFFGAISGAGAVVDTQGSARRMEVTSVDDRIATADDVELFNALLGTNLPPGTLYDLVQAETDVTIGNRRIEIGLSYVSLDTAVVTDDAYPFLPDFSAVDLVLYFIVEEVDDVLLFEALGQVSAQGAVAVGPDTDLDGVSDAFDNCTLAANGPLLRDAGGVSQRDTNGDGFGNVCDPDLNDDGIVNVVDLGLLRSVFFTGDANADLNGDGVVNVVDLGLLRALFFMPPGPAGSL